MRCYMATFQSYTVIFCIYFWMNANRMPANQSSPLCQITLFFTLSCVVCTSNIPETPPIFQMPKHVRDVKGLWQESISFHQQSLHCIQEERDHHPFHNEIMTGKKQADWAIQETLDMIFYRCSGLKVELMIIFLRFILKGPRKQLLLGRSTCCNCKMQIVYSW